jgi:hypothetical protein
MSETIFNYSETTPIAEASSPTSVSWFIDRTGDPSLLEDLTPRSLSWPESDHIILEELSLIRYPNVNINDSRYSQQEIRSGRYFINSYTNNNININTNDFENFVVCNTIVNTTAPVVIDEDMEVTAEQQDCCICMEQKDKTDICLLSCSHSFCIDCSSSNFTCQISMHERPNCPLCRAEVTSVRVQSTENRDKFLMR